MVDIRDGKQGSTREARPPQPLFRALAKHSNETFGTPAIPPNGYKTAHRAAFTRLPSRYTHVSNFFSVENRWRKILCGHAGQPVASFFLVYPGVANA